MYRIIILSTIFCKKSHSNECLDKIFKIICKDHFPCHTQRQCKKQKLIKLNKLERQHKQKTEQHNKATCCSTFSWNSFRLWWRNLGCRWLNFRFFWSGYILHLREYYVLFNLQVMSKTNKDYTLNE